MISDSDCQIEVHLFGCGHGDTILLRLPVDKWVLVDCRLPKYDGTRDRFFEYIQQQGIQRLEYVIQTHPDYDHFHGMVDVLKYFTSNGRSVGVWCDAGINAPSVRDIVWHDEITESFYAKLQKCLDDLYVQKLIEIREITDQVRPFGPKDFPGIRLIPIAPTGADKRRIIRSGVESLAKNPTAKLETNALTIVLVLTVKNGDCEFNVLLSGDADPEKLRVGVSTWRAFATGAERSSDFNVVKVSHHGSAASHLSELCSTGSVEFKIAAVSAGDRSGLPAVSVIKEWQDSGWTVVSTTTRHAKRRYNRPSELVSRIRPSFTSRSHDIKIKWTPTDGVLCTPEESRITPADLIAYQ